MSAVNKVNFLLQAASLFPPNGHVNQLLKSHYLSTSREVAEKNVELPKKEFGEKRMCQKCSAIWLDGNLKLKICSKILRKRRLKNLIAKVEASELMSRKQRAKAKWLKKNAQSRVEITCLLCKHKTKLHLEKPKKRNDSTPPQPLQATGTTPATTSQDSISLVNSSSSQKKLTKKRKKDKFAGLNPSLVAQATTTSSIGSASSTISVINPTPSTSKTCIASTSAKPSVVSSASNNKKIEKNILPQSHNIKKSKKKSKTKPPNAGQPAVKEVSKTQQKNTLLQLAQLLKTGASLASKKFNPLENLLR